MDLTTTIIGLLILALFILPIILISMAGKGKGKKFEKEFFSEVSRNELKISEKDFCNEFAIGIDTSTNKVIYFDWSGPDRFKIIFDLADVKIFESIPGFKELNKKNFTYKNVNRLGLRFQFKEPDKPEVNITFYLAGFGKLSDQEAKLFKKWLDIFRNKMESKSVDEIRHSA
jgi:hypothetical protein